MSAAYVAIGLTRLCRKDWRTLLWSYWTEFSHSDNVTLLLRTDPNEHEWQAVRREIVQSLQVPAAELPAVQIVRGKLDRAAMDSLLLSADVVVQCSHGEGSDHPLC